MHSSCFLSSCRVQFLHAKDHMECAIAIPLFLMFLVDLACGREVELKIKLLGVVSLCNVHTSCCFDGGIGRLLPTRDLDILPK